METYQEEGTTVDHDSQLTNKNSHERKKSSCRPWDQSLSSVNVFLTRQNSVLSCLKMRRIWMNSKASWRSCSSWTTPCTNPEGNLSPFSHNLQQDYGNWVPILLQKILQMRHRWVFKSVKIRMGNTSFWPFICSWKIRQIFFRKTRKTAFCVCVVMTLLLIWQKKYLGYTLFEKSNFCPKIRFWQNFTIFSRNQSCQQLKSANSQHFHEFFT